MDGQMSLFGFDDDMGFETIGITGGEDVIISKEEKEEKEEKAPVSAPVRKTAAIKLKIDGVFVCMGCGKLLTKTVEGDRFKAYCNCCDVTYSGNN